MYHDFLNEWCAKSTVLEAAQNARHTIAILEDEYEIDHRRARAAFADWFLTFAGCNLPHEIAETRDFGRPQPKGFTVQVVDNMTDKNVVEERHYA
jgi:hypothetical protein